MLTKSPKLTQNKTKQPKSYSIVGVLRSKSAIKQSETGQAQAVEKIYINKNPIQVEHAVYKGMHKQTTRRTWKPGRPLQIKTSTLTHTTLASFRAKHRTPANQLMDVMQTQKNEQQSPAVPNPLVTKCKQEARTKTLYLFSNVLQRLTHTRESSPRQQNRSGEAWKKKKTHGVDGLFDTCTRPVTETLHTHAATAAAPASSDYSANVILD